MTSLLLKLSLGQFRTFKLYTIWIEMSYNSSSVGYWKIPYGWHPKIQSRLGSSWQFLELSWVELQVSRAELSRAKLWWKILRAELSQNLIELSQFTNIFFFNSDSVVDRCVNVCIFSEYLIFYIMRDATQLSTFG